MYMYVYVYVYVYMYVYVCTYSYMYIYIYIYVLLSTTGRHVGRASVALVGWKTVPRQGLREGLQSGFGEGA